MAQCDGCDELENEVERLEADRDLFDWYFGQERFQIHRRIQGVRLTDTVDPLDWSYSDWPSVRVAIHHARELKKSDEQ